MRRLLSRRWWRRAGVAAAAAVALLAVAAVALDRAFPPNLERLQQVSTLVLDKDGAVLRAFTTADGTWRLPVTPDEVDPLYLDMVVAWEDKRFPGHFGVDPLALARAFAQFVASGRIVSGGSTLTMQTARLLEPRPRTLGAKLIEMFRAVQLEMHFEKREILSMYLTLAPFGGNLEGVRAASLFYFGKEPRYLTAAEAALLVSLPQAPERLRPDRSPALAKAARDRVLARMQALGLVDESVLARSVAMSVPEKRRPAPMLAPHLASRLRAADPAAGSIATLIDGPLQRGLEMLADRRQDELEPGASIAILVIDNTTRAVRAYVGSADLLDAQQLGFNDMVRAVRSPGSALKPFIYAMAFDDLIVHPETMMSDVPARFGDYAPQNFDRHYRGEVTAREALQLSLNLPAVALFDRIGPGRFVHALREAEVTLSFPDNVTLPGLPVALGGVGITLEQLVMLYAALADGGTVKPLRYRPDDPVVEGARLFGPAACWYVSRILEDAPPPPGIVPWRHRAHGSLIAFKTGTSYGFRDAWAIGYDASFTVGVWVGRPDGSFSPGRLGREAAAPILFEVFDRLGPGAAPGERGIPEGVLIASTAQLPANLQRFDKPDLARLTQSKTAPTIVFPADGATLELSSPDGELASLPLKAAGGEMPLLWLVNGEPIAASPFRRQTQWVPDGTGLARVTVIDKAGRAATAEVWVQ